MGTWGPGLYENDDAADWIANLSEHGLTALETAFDAVLDGEYVTSADGARAAAAAGALVHLISGDGDQGHGDDIAAWVESTTERASVDLVAKGRLALQRVLGPESELAELWAEDTDLHASWQATLRRLEAALSGDITASPRTRPRRATKRPRPIKVKRGDIVEIADDDADGYAVYVHVLGMPEQRNVGPMVRVLTSSAPKVQGVEALDLSGRHLGHTMCVVQDASRCRVIGRRDPMGYIPTGVFARDLIGSGGPVSERWWVYGEQGTPRVTAGEFGRVHPEIDQEDLPWLSGFFSWALVRYLREGMDLRQSNRRPMGPSFDT